MLYDKIDLAIKMAWLLMFISISVWGMWAYYKDGYRSGWEDCLEARRWTEKEEG